MGCVEADPCTAGRVTSRAAGFDDVEEVMSIALFRRCLRALWELESSD